MNTALSLRTYPRARLALAGAFAFALSCFRDLGRFAEPRFRRASALLGNPSYGARFLSKIGTANTIIAAGE